MSNTNDCKCEDCDKVCAMHEQKIKNDEQIHNRLYALFGASISIFLVLAGYNQTSIANSAEDIEDKVNSVITANIAHERKAERHIANIESNTEFRVEQHDTNKQMERVLVGIEKAMIRFESKLDNHIKNTN